MKTEEQKHGDVVDCKVAIIFEVALQIHYFERIFLSQ